MVAEYRPVGRTVPIYNGEWGYASGSGAWPLLDPTDQGKLVPRLLLSSIMATDGVSIYYEWRDGGNTSSGELMGLLYDGPAGPDVPKPAYKAVQALWTTLLPQAKGPMCKLWIRQHLPNPEVQME